MRDFQDGQIDGSRYPRPRCNRADVVPRVHIERCFPCCEVFMWKKGDSVNPKIGQDFTKHTFSVALKLVVVVAVW